MVRQAHFEENMNVLTDNHPSDHHARSPTRGGDLNRLTHAQSHDARAHASGAESKRRGLSFGSQRINPPASLATNFQRRKNVDDKDADPFHSVETDLLISLFIAVDGAVRGDGLLDVDKLDEYSPEDAEDLNVQGLREFWSHTRSCPRCELIVNTLHMIRGTLSEGAGEVDPRETSDAPRF
jgi:hypothetical protein